MSIPKRHQTNMRVRFGGLILLIVLTLMVAGCTKNYGNFKKSDEVTTAFRQGDHQPEYQYYYSGRDNMPYAIIGIDRNYTVPSRYWIPFEPESEMLSKMSGNMFGKHKYYPTGYYILDPDGKIIGVWFSSVNSYSVSVDQTKRTVEVLFRNPENSRSLSFGYVSHSTESTHQTN
jgi:hypothetical protein